MSRYASTISGAAPLPPARAPRPLASTLTVDTEPVGEALERAGVMVPEAYLTGEAEEAGVTAPKGGAAARKGLGAGGAVGAPAPASAASAASATASAALVAALGA